ncbi:MAG TPA: enoyl-ACP reductase [Longimicrobiales bacterium]|nr:enoyl-ACP reductase [Longimicrobiales bacterium]
MALRQDLYAGKRVLVFGVANERSIAWGITQAMRAAGARIGLTFLNEALEKRVRPLGEEVGAELILPCDVGRSEQVREVFARTKEAWGGVDVVIHSVAFATREDMGGRFVDTSRAGFLQAMEISAYSLVELAREAEPLFPEGGGSILTLTYYGAEKVVPNYNVMGVAKAALEACVRYLASDLGATGTRVNAISAGPIRTLAAAGGVKGFRDMLSLAEQRAPLRRNVSQEDVGNAALFLCSELAAGITGEVMYVDCGYNIMAM